MKRRSVDDQRRSFVADVIALHQRRYGGAIRAPVDLDVLDGTTKQQNQKESQLGLPLGTFAKLKSSNEFDGLTPTAALNRLHRKDQPTRSSKPLSWIDQITTMLSCTELSPDKVLAYGGSKDVGRHLETVGFRWIDHTRGRPQPNMLMNYTLAINFRGPTPHKETMPWDNEVKRLANLGLIYAVTTRTSNISGIASHLYDLRDEIRAHVLKLKSSLN